MDEVEVRCGGCATRWPGRTPTLLATLHGGIVHLPPERFGTKRAQRLGVGRRAPWGRIAAMDGTTALLRCRRCKELTRYDVSKATMAAAARSAARPSVAT